MKFVLFQTFTRLRPNQSGGMRVEIYYDNLSLAMSLIVVTCNIRKHESNAKRDTWEWVESRLDQESSLNKA